MEGETENSDYDRDSNVNLYRYRHFDEYLKNNNHRTL